MSKIVSFSYPQYVTFDVRETLQNRHGITL